MCPEFWVHIKFGRAAFLAKLFFHYENLRALSSPAEAVRSRAYEAEFLPEGKQIGLVVIDHDDANACSATASNQGLKRKVCSPSEPLPLRGGIQHKKGQIDITVGALHIVENAEGALLHRDEAESKAVVSCFPAFFVDKVERNLLLPEVMQKKIRIRVVNAECREARSCIIAKSFYVHVLGSSLFRLCFPRKAFIM